MSNLSNTIKQNATLLQCIEDTSTDNSESNLSEMSIEIASQNGIQIPNELLKEQLCLYVSNKLDTISKKNELQEDLKLLNDIKDIKVNTSRASKLYSSAFLIAEKRDINIPCGLSIIELCNYISNKLYTMSEKIDLESDLYLLDLYRKQSCDNSHISVINIAKKYNVNIPCGLLNTQLCTYVYREINIKLAKIDAESYLNACKIMLTNFKYTKYLEKNKLNQQQLLSLLSQQLLWLMDRYVEYTDILLGPKKQQSSKLSMLIDTVRGQGKNVKSLYIARFSNPITTCYP